MCVEGVWLCLWKIGVDSVYKWAFELDTLREKWIILNVGWDDQAHKGATIRVSEAMPSKVKVYDPYPSIWSTPMYVKNGHRFFVAKGYSSSKG